MNCNIRLSLQRKRSSKLAFAESSANFGRKWGSPSASDPRAKNTGQRVTKGTVLTWQSLSPWCDCRRSGSTWTSWRWQDINVRNPLWRRALLLAVVRAIAVESLAAVTGSSTVSIYVISNVNDSRSVGAVAQFTDSKMLPAKYNKYQNLSLWTLLRMSMITKHMPFVFINVPILVVSCYMCL